MNDPEESITRRLGEGLKQIFKEDEEVVRQPQPKSNWKFYTIAGLFVAGFWLMYIALAFWISEVKF